MNRITDNRKEWLDKELARIFDDDADHIKRLLIETIKISPQMKRKDFTEYHKKTL